MIIIITIIFIINYLSFIGDTDTSSNPNLSGQHERGTPLLLVLGYSNGVQIWHITVSCFLSSSSVFFLNVIFVTKQPELISPQCCLLSSSSVLTGIFINEQPELISSQCCLPSSSSVLTVIFISRPPVVFCVGHQSFC